MTKDPSHSDLTMANHIREIYSSIKHAPVATDVPSVAADLQSDAA